MKTLVTLILFTISATASDVVVNSLTSVTIDGSPAGSVVDVLANHDVGDVRARLLDALIARENSLMQSRDAAVTDANAARAETAIKVQAEKAKNAELRSAIQSGDEKILAEVVKDEKEKRSAELEAQIAALQKQKEEIK